MWWSDSKIQQQVKQGGLVIDPFSLDYLNPCGIDVTLGTELITYKVLLDACREYNEYDIVRHDIDHISGMTLARGFIYLGCIEQYIKLDRNTFAEVTGKSSLGRLGLSVHSTAGHIDPGFEGYITLELSVVQSVRIFAGMKIAQIRFGTVDGEVNEAYNEKKNSKYCNQPKEPIISRYSKDRTNLRSTRGDS
jgi:dCTP deaminase